ncbi:MAG: cardiolipin synthase [Sphaerochaetaceae bacterium]|nr:cardiolipin synthase [Sphaerochaetaceae bacterium]
MSAAKSVKRTVEKRKAFSHSFITTLLIVLSLVIQVFTFIGLTTFITDSYIWVQIAFNIVAVILVLAIFGRQTTSMVKIPWIILIVSFPVFGVLLYMLTGSTRTLKSIKKRYEKIDSIILPLLPKNEKALSSLKKLSIESGNQASYVIKSSGYPVYNNSNIKFFTDASSSFEDQLIELSKARKFIFMEYHAIENSGPFERIRIILKKKASEGVDVRLFFDYFGSSVFINSRKFVKSLRDDGIKCYVFNPIVPVYNMFMNNRDHRKLTIIDGRIGYTGGFNIADEYFNITHPYGHWLDTGVKIEGEAVKSMTVIFMENWMAIRNTQTPEKSPDKYLIKPRLSNKEGCFIQPYADGPTSFEHVAENVYANILTGADRYVYFITPYLIISDELRYAFKLAAGKGVDVRIITPGIPDKKIVYALTRSNYYQLVSEGIRIYEYTPGFCHAKQCVSDDFVATCGTINLDFRSLYHHFENGVQFFNSSAVMDIKKQFDQLFPQCEEVTEKYRKRSRGFKYLAEQFFKLFSPLA